MNKNKTTDHLRLFFAIELTDEIRNELKQLIKNLRQQTNSRWVRWIPVENYHLTTRFIGTAKVEQIPELITAATTAIKDLPIFDVNFDVIRVFPTASHPRVLALMIKPNPDLFNLAEKLELAVTNCGFTAESRAYLPHLSLARLSRNPHLDLTNLVTLKNNITVDRVLLFNSTIENSQRKYEVISTIKLFHNQMNCS